MLNGKRIVLGVCGGIAAYKSAVLLRLLVKAGANCRVIMTQNAREFVGAATFAALSGSPVYDEMFGDRNAGAAIRHIAWAEEADAVIVAPATANIAGKFAGGIADDVLSTFLLAATCPILICPSMNTNMLLSPPVQRNLQQLEKDGHTVLAPVCGALACGASGAGRLPEPHEIVDRLLSRLSPCDLAGRTVLITAGPTREALDPVRFITNPSSGKMGYALARAAEHRGARVLLVSGPSGLEVPLNVERIMVQTAAEMADAVLSRLPDVHALIKSAAVSDYRPEIVSDHKIKKADDGECLRLIRTMDILKEAGRRKTDQVLVGFAAETRDLATYARGKLLSKNLDMIVGNLVGHPGSGFGADTNEVVLYHADGRVEPLPSMSKDAAAHEILDRVSAIMRRRGGGASAAVSDHTGSRWNRQ
ncbi:MAG: bifunctional phosphopantothenoylcysteine decarboxylase/phosphopantothenate--cysteine ligase CoaBC [Desulfobacterales bacterium]|nr:MAG: bifunctional phosphopantothenoylcysteine decarboxylase/phosphopantothenate--cysteine ligase CoaBC [Desulfobacterales bacterium]